MNQWNRLAATAMPWAIRQIIGESPFLFPFLEQLLCRSLL
jgi:hypothetical protein